MIIEDAIVFLKNTPPFGLLDVKAVTSIASEVLMEFHPKEHTILYQGGPPAEYLSIIKNGAVKVFVRTNEDEEILIDYKTAGDSFGFLSLLYGDVSLDNVVAAEDTSCYLIKKETILDLLKTNSEFAEFYLRTFLRRLVDMTYNEIHNRTLLYGGGDKLLFTNTLSDMAEKKVITASKDITIKEAAEIMSRHKISSLVLLDSDGLPEGIVTDRDLRDKVVSKGRDVIDKISTIMSVTLIKSESSDYCFEALLKMIRYKIHHLLVVSKGDLKGIITNHDLMMFQGTSPLSIAREIENQKSIDGLVPVSRKINRTINILIKEEAKSRNITRIITEINDRLLKKILEITTNRLGNPPVSYCWVVFGSEGRKEQTFRTDQDNAIIYDNPKGIDDKNVKNYFSEFGAYMKDSLIKCSFPACTADYMASNPKWCQPLNVWEKYFHNWISKPTPEAVLLSLIFFDFRAVYGNFMLTEKLRAYLSQALKNQKVFFANMAGAILKNRPPLGFFKTFRVEKTGVYKDKLNIKMNALCPIIDSVRLSALEMGIYNTSTVERLKELKDKNSTINEFCSDLEHAFEFLMSLRLKHQFEQIQADKEPDNFINPDCLGTMEKRTLKDCFKLILWVQEAIKTKYGPYITM
jgi:CBS domain-containing protein